MIPYAAYKVVHITGILLLFGGLGATAWYWARKPDREETKGERRFLYAIHGVAMFIVLLGGFGLLARLGIKHGSGWPTWAYAKVVVWILLGGSVVLFKRLPHLSRPLLLAVPVLGAVAAYLAIYKPI